MTDQTPESASALTPEVQRTQEAVAFLRAQWDEEAAELDRLIDAPSVQGYLRVHGARLREDIDAKREILDHCVFFMGWTDEYNMYVTESEINAMRFAGREILRRLILPYVNMDGYRKEWKL